MYDIMAIITQRHAIALGQGKPRKAAHCFDMVNRRGRNGLALRLAQLTFMVLFFQYLGAQMQPRMADVECMKIVCRN
jgi:hypothetical protein